MFRSKPLDVRLAAREVRTVPLDKAEVRATDGDAINVAGHAAVFDSPTWIGPPRWGFSEVIARGAFTKTLADKADVRFLFNHDPSMVLARTKSGSLSLSEDKIGLAVEARLAPTSVGQDLAVLMDRGDVDQMSFGFRVVRDEWEEIKGADGMVYERRTIFEVELFDVSSVTYPAYEDTDVGLNAADLARELRGRPKPTGTPATKPTRPAKPGRRVKRATDATAAELVAAADATIDAIEDAWDTPEQAFGLLTALDECIDSLMELLGIPDPDEDEGDEGASATTPPETTTEPAAGEPAPAPADGEARDDPPAEARDDPPAELTAPERRALGAAHALGEHKPGPAAQCAACGYTAA